MNCDHVFLKIMIRLVASMLAALAFVSSAQPQNGVSDAAVTLNTEFPPMVEEALALSAAPQNLRANATVYVYGPKGYTKFRNGTNGFTCLVNRDSLLYGGNTFKPTCWDKQGEDTYVPVMRRVGALLSQGATADAIRKDIDSGFVRGKYRAPRSGGVAYMLAGDLELNLTSGQIVRQTFPGHYMFYAVGVTNAQLGVTREALTADPTLPSVFTGGAGGDHGLGYIIAVPGDAHPSMHSSALGPNLDSSSDSGQGQ